MSYIASNLLPGERLLYRAHLHGIVFAKAVALVVLGICVPLGAPVLLPPACRGLVFFLALGGIVSGLLWLVLAGWTYTTAEFGVTTKRVLCKSGSMRCHTADLLLWQLEALAVDQSLLGRVLGYGTLTLTGPGGVREVFRHIEAPCALRRQIHLAGERGAAVPATWGA